MKTRMMIAAVAIVSLVVGHTIGQRTGFAAGPLGAQAASSNVKLPPSSDGAKARLSASSRRGELAKTTANGAPLNLWVSYPDRKDKAPLVVLIHGASAFDDWIRAVADQLASEGFIAIAPDLLTGHGPNGGGTESYASADDVGKAIQTLQRPEIIARLNATRDFGLKLPQASGKSAVIGFCFGGSQTFMYSTQQPGLNAAVVFYGSAPAAPGSQSAGPGAAPPTSYTPSAAMLANIKAPVLGLYGGADARINATVPATQEKMKELGKIYEPHFFEGAGHAFLSGQGGMNGANMKATEQSWPIAVSFLKRHTDGRT